MNWRKTGKPVNLDPNELYKMAKSLDGYPDVDGTTLQAIMEGMINLGWTNKKLEDIRFFYTVDELKRVIHRYGTALIACDIGMEWSLQLAVYDMKQAYGDPLGGHAITCCGYDRKGIIIQNSWGMHWGYYGYCRIAYDLFEKEFREGCYYANILNDLED